MQAAILVADASALSVACQAAAARTAGMPPVQPFTDGAAAIHHFVQLSRRQERLSLLVVDELLPYVGGRGVVRAVRAVERAFGQPPVPVVLYSGQRADEDTKAFLAEVGRAIHLTRPPGQDTQALAQRFVIASQQLLAKLQQGGA